MFYFGILAVLWSVLAYSIGFTMDRSALVPSMWDTAPSLDTYQKVFVDPALNGKIQVTGMDNILQAADVKVSVKLTEQMPQNQTRKKRSTTENTTTGMKLVNDGVTLVMKNDSSNVSVENANTVTPLRNVILLLIDESSSNESNHGNSWEDCKKKLPFAIEGFLQSCRDEIKATNFTVSSAIVLENKEKNCDCEHILRSNIVDLLSWARHAKGMTTGTVSGSNFSIPSFPRYEFDAFDENEAKFEQRMDKHNSKDPWQMINLSDQTKSLSPVTMADSKSDGMSNFDGTWNIFDVFSKMWMAFFRSLLESVGRNNNTSEEEFSSRKPFLVKPSTISLIENTIKELKSFPNNKGYILIATVPSNEHAVVIDLLQREISPKDTLLVMMEICSGKKSVPFIAEGSNSGILREIKTIWELPIAIRKAIETNCHDPECINRQKRDAPIISRVPMEFFLGKTASAKARY
ncbi:hypothetical protein DMN91_000392 [Ooceraea biroi]|nr:hypothetical protein DMN91_000392 [Ooceraea biroi]